MESTINRLEREKESLTLTVSDLEESLQDIEVNISAKDVHLNFLTQHITSNPTLNFKNSILKL